MIGLFEPDRIRPYAHEELVGYALRGWEIWADLVTDEVGERVLALAQDTAPLTRALANRPMTMIHGDLATVNMAFERRPPDPHRLGPGDAQRRARWTSDASSPAVPTCSTSTADTFMAMYREEAGDVYDEAATRLGLLGGLVWLGWNKALDIVEHPDEDVREREKAALAVVAGPRPRGLSTTGPLERGP